MSLQINTRTTLIKSYYLIQTKHPVWILDKKKDKSKGNPQCCQIIIR